MLAELQERDATGEVAAVYEEIRRFCAVPYVSSMQRHLATRPGWLEWVWAALRPVFANGRAQGAAWRVAEGFAVPALPPIAREALRVWGVDAAGEAAVRAICDNFIRASPTNLVLSGLLRLLLSGQRPSGPVGPAGDWVPPPPLPPLPTLVEVAALSPAERSVLMSLGTMVGGEPFVPGLYRLLARWPNFLAHAATVLRPHLEDAGTRARCRELAAAIDAEIPPIFALLPALPERPPVPPAGEFGDVLAALDAYRTTSPQMIVFGRMIRNALPPPSPASASRA